MDALKIEEMEKLLKEAHLEKARLLESKVSGNLLILLYEDVIALTEKNFTRLKSKFSWCFLLCLCILQERETQVRKQLLEEERKRREEAEKRLQEETVHRQQLIEKEVKMRAKNFSQVRQTMNWRKYAAPQKICWAV